jgi:hypothetical protein
MKVYMKPRGGGKTTSLIHTSAVTGYPILVSTVTQANHIQKMAEHLGLKIPEPVIITQHWRSTAKLHAGILIDDLDLMLEQILEGYLGTHVIAATMSSDK